MEERAGGLHFFLSDLVADDAAAVFAEHERRIRARLPAVQIRHTGGTSVRGVLTSGDVDLQVRAERESFETACQVLYELYEPHHPQAWHAEGAFFKAETAVPRVEVALTAIGSLDDLHHGEAWDRIAADPNLAAGYNAMKRQHEGGSPDAYNAAKRDFFYGNFRL